MKKKFTSQFAFPNVRVLVGLFIFLAFLLGLGVFFNAAAQVNGDTKFSLWNPLVWMEQKVTASDGTANSYFGSAAALNGSTALIGADGHNSFQGAAYLFTKSNRSWSQGQKLTASDGLAGDEFGYRVVLANDTLLVGAFTATVGGNASQGAAYLFTESNGTWSESQKLTATDGGLFDNFGASVALDGSTLVVGANGATVGGNAGQGALYVFAESNGTWSQVQKLTASDGTANSSFGESVALNGSTALIGANNATVNGHSFQGAAYIFSESNGTWSQVQKLTASDGAANSNFGSAVALNGSTALIGADGSTVGGNTYQGKAYLFTESGGNWSQSDTFIASDGAVDDYFGAALAWDGATALISTPHPVINGNAYQGAAYFYQQSGTPRPSPTPKPRPTPHPRPTL